MKPDDQPIVVGVTDEQSSGPGPSPPGQRIVPVLVSLFAAAAVVAGVMSGLEDGVPSAVEPTDLNAPVEPPVIADSPAAPPADTGAWQRLEMVGAGWTGWGVDHGPLGWVAVSQGDSLTAHLSKDGTIWEPHTIHGAGGSFLGEAAVGDHLIAVAGSNPRDVPWPTAAISDDGGATWAPVTIPARTAVDTVVAAGERVYVAGGTVGPDGEAFESGATADLWRLGGSEAKVVASAPEGHHYSSLIANPDGDTLLFGGADGGPAAWIIEDDALERITIDVPGETSMQQFVDVALTENGLVAVMGDQPDSGRTVVFSRDASTWELADGIETSRAIRSVEPYAGGLLGVIPEQSGVWSSSEGPMDVFSSPLTPMNQVNGLAAAADTIAIVGDLGVVAVRGVVEPPVVAPLDTSTVPRWSEVSRLDVGTEDFPFATMLGWGQVGDASVLVSGNTVAEIEDDGGLTIQRTTNRRSTVGLGPQGMWLATPGSPDTTIDIFDGETWTSESVPLTSVLTITVVDRRIVALGFGGGGQPTVARQNPTGDWTTAPTELEGLPAPVPGGFLISAAAADGSPAVVFSEDGETWTVVDRGRSLFGAPGLRGVPFLHDPEQPSTITLVDRWPDTTELEVPTPYVTEVYRHDEGYVARALGSMYVSAADGEWVEYPLDIEHGLYHRFTVIPSADPMVASMDDGSVRLLRWSDAQSEAPPDGRVSRLVGRHGAGPLCGGTVKNQTPSPIQC